MNEVDPELRKLIEEARGVMRNALARSSRFLVGAAIRTSEGRVYTGANIETATLNLGMCAERLALFKALSEGEREFTDLAVVASTGKVCPPCGGCRQILWEYAPGLRVILAGEEPEPTIITIEELMPLPFDKTNVRGGTDCDPPAADPHDPHGTPRDRLRHRRP